MKPKPDLTFFFSAMPGLNSIWMRYEYENANNKEELTRLAYKWMDEAEESKNPIRRQNYTAGFHFLFAFLTGRSFDSKLVIEKF